MAKLRHLWGMFSDSLNNNQEAWKGWRGREAAEREHCQPQSEMINMEMYIYIIQKQSPDFTLKTNIRLTSLASHQGLENRMNWISGSSQTILIDLHFVYHLFVERKTSEVANVVVCYYQIVYYKPNGPWVIEAKK